MSAINYDAVSARLKAIRNSKGYSQAEMGSVLKMGQYYGNIERGSERPSELALIKIAEILEIDQEWLIHGTGEPPVKIDPAIKHKQEPKPEEKSEPKQEPEPVPAAGPMRSQGCVTITKKEVVYELSHDEGVYAILKISNDGFSMDSPGFSFDGINSNALKCMIDMLKAVRHIGVMQ